MTTPDHGSNRSSVLQQQYIGVTGFMNSTQVEDALSVVQEGKSWKLMVGVLVSSTTLWGHANPSPERYPNLEKTKISDIFVASPAAFNVVHYHTRVPKGLSDQLEEILEMAPDLIHGFQLNVVWPDPLWISEFSQKHPDIKLILQVDPKALQLVGHNEGQLCEMLRKYRNMIHYVLLDDSGGVGKTLDPGLMAKLALRVHRSDLGMAVVIAGGLCEANLNIIAPILEEIPGLSIDAEGKLFNEKNPEKGLDVVGKAVPYLFKGIELFTFFEQQRGRNLSKK